MQALKIFVYLSFNSEVTHGRAAKILNFVGKVNLCVSRHLYDCLSIHSA